MEAQRINPDNVCKPLASYCQVVRKGNIVTTAGQVAIDPAGDIVGMGDIVAQTRQTLENLKNSLAAAGAEMTDVIKTMIFISDLANYKGMNEVYDEYFANNPPARSTVRADLALPDLLVEIEAIAVV